MGHVREAGESGPIDGEFGVMVITDGSADIVTRHRTHDVRTSITAGFVSLMSGSRRRHVLRMDGRATAACLNVPKDWFARLGFAEPPSEFGAREYATLHPNLVGLAQAMRMEIEAGVATSRLYAESLSLALLSYVVEHVAAHGPQERVRGKLSPKQCQSLRAYIRDRLAEDVTLAELAAITGMSPRHFSGLFREAFGATPHRYLVRLRLQEGVRLLSAGERDIARIALELGFCSQSHFSAAFRKEFGAPPGKYAALHGLRGQVG
jgi:AraC-like DNA-binding protein